MRCAIISDIHGNLDALEAVLADAGEVDAIWCLGDLVGYGPQPNECIALLRSRSALCVAGNHDWAAIGKMGTAEFNPEASEAARWTQAALSPEHRDYLASLPEQLTAGASGEFTLVHGSPRDPIWEYLTHASLARLAFDYFQTPYCLVGHTHVPLVFERPLPEDATPAYRTVVPAEGNPLTLGVRRLIANPGSVGQPRDGNPAAAYMMYESGANRPAAGTSVSRAAADSFAGSLTLKRVTYPVASVQRRMTQAGLPARLITRLTYGW
jgi:predicted phosphodiesterase